MRMLFVVAHFFPLFLKSDFNFASNLSRSKNFNHQDQISGVSVHFPEHSKNNIFPEQLRTNRSSWQLWLNPFFLKEYMLLCSFGNKTLTSKSSVLAQKVHYVFKCRRWIVSSLIEKLEQNILKSRLKMKQTSLLDYF